VNRRSRRMKSWLSPGLEVTSHKVCSSSCDSRRAASGDVTCREKKRLCPHAAGDQAEVIASSCPLGSVRWCSRSRRRRRRPAVPAVEGLAHLHAASGNRWDGILHPAVPPAADGPPAAAPRNVPATRRAGSVCLRESRCTTTPTGESCRSGVDKPPPRTPAVQPPRTREWLPLYRQAKRSLTSSWARRIEGAPRQGDLLRLSSPRRSASWARRTRPIRRPPESLHDCRPRPPPVPPSTGPRVSQPSARQPVRR